MDLEEGQRRGFGIPDRSPEIPEDERVEPWGWHSKIAPRHIRRRLRLYREFLERLGDHGDQ
jgi:hypothetical protein